MKVAVLVTLLDDRRVVRALGSLAAQSRRPEEVLVADGGSTDGSREAAIAFAHEHPWVRVERLPGSVAETRNAALARLDCDVVAFLDADETAPPGWLAALVRPLEEGEAAFAGGPTRPLGPAQTKGEEYLNAFEAWFYPEVVARDVTKLPMGNSAWRLDVLREVGGFDPRLTWGGEDYDVNLRVVRAGHKGAFIPEAWVFHDQSGRTTLFRILRRKFRYNVGAAMAYRKNGVLRSKMRDAARNSAKFRHPYERWNWLIQPAALARALLWRPARRSR